MTRHHSAALALVLGLAFTAFTGCADLPTTGYYPGYSYGSPSPSPSSGMPPSDGNGTSTPNPDAVDVSGHWGVSLTSGSSFYMDLVENSDGTLDGTATSGGLNFTITGSRQRTNVTWVMRSGSKSVTYTGVESQAGRQIKGSAVGSTQTNDFVAIRH